MISRSLFGSITRSSCFNRGEPFQQFQLECAGIHGLDRCPKGLRRDHYLRRSRFLRDEQMQLHNYIAGNGLPARGMKNGKCRMINDHDGSFLHLHSTIYILLSFAHEPPTPQLRTRPVDCRYRRMKNENGMIMINDGSPSTFFFYILHSTVIRHEPPTPQLRTRPVDCRYRRNEEWKM